LKVFKLSTYCANLLICFCYKLFYSDQLPVFIRAKQLVTKADE